MIFASFETVRPDAGVGCAAFQYPSCIFVPGGALVAQTPQEGEVPAGPLWILPSTCLRHYLLRPQ